MQKSHYPLTALKTSKSLGKTAKALEAQEVLKKKQVGFLFYASGCQRLWDEIGCQLYTCFFLFLSGGLKAPAGHEEEEAGDVKDTD